MLTHSSTARLLKIKPFPGSTFGDGGRYATARDGTPLERWGNPFTSDYGDHWKPADTTDPDFVHAVMRRRQGALASIGAGMGVSAGSVPRELRSFLESAVSVCALHSTASARVLRVTRDGYVPSMGGQYVGALAAGERIVLVELPDVGEHVMVRTRATSKQLLAGVRRYIA